MVLEMMDNMAPHFDMAPAPSTALQTTAAEATLAAMVALLSDAAAMAMAVGSYKLTFV